MNTKKPPYKPEDLAMVHKYVKDIAIMRVLVISTNFFRSELIDQHPDMQMKVNIENEVTAYTNPEHKQAWAHIKLALFTNPINTEFNEAVPFKIETVIETRYEYKGDELFGEMFTRVMNAFCHTASVTHAWSFFRQQVVDALGRMMLPPIMLPLLVNQLNTNKIGPEKEAAKTIKKNKIN